jgi:SAM-dependent methyltransferase
MIEPGTHKQDHSFFDQYAEQYDSALQQGLSLSGENSQYFARGRVAWLAALLNRLELRCRNVLDFGCGTGASAPYFREFLGAAEIVGVDPSSTSLECARHTRADLPARFCLPEELEDGEHFDLAFCNGVFHHIPPPQRSAALSYIRRRLRPGGALAFWENNPWNPGTRWVMSRIPFDRDAVTVAPPEARRLLRANGFEVLRTDFLFIFPRLLRFLRPLEARLCRLPLGAQYQVLCRT